MKQALILTCFSLIFLVLPSEALVVDSSRVWNKSQLSVTFVSGTNEEKNLVKMFANEWTRYANIDFEFYDDPSLVPNWSQAEIRIAIESVQDPSLAAGSSSVGRPATPLSYSDRYRPSMRIRIQSQFTASRRVILHEFGHALALKHEHQHPDRPPWRPENICAELGISQDRCEKNVESVVTGEKFRIFAYDENSIMHYRIGDVGGLSVLSLADKINIAKLYPGRRLEQEIRETHSEELEVISETRVYGNCEFLNRREGEKELFFYKNHRTKLRTPFNFKTKEESIQEAQADEDCRATKVRA